MTLLNFTFQESSPLISYSFGQWTEVTGGTLASSTCVCQCNDKSYITTESFGATAILTFLGTGISLFGAKNNTHGNYTVQVDQNLFVETGFRQTSEFNVSLFEDFGLEYGQHTVVIKNLPSSNRSVFDLDAILIERQLGPPGYNGTIFVTSLDDTAPWVSYSGEWTQVPSTTAYHDTLHLTTQASAQVTVSFQGSSIELYGRYANAPFIAQLDNTPPMSLAGPQINLAPEDEHPQTLLYLMDALSEEEIHNVTLTNLQSNINRPFFFDYAVVRSSKQYFKGSTDGNETSGLLSSSSSSSSSTKFSSLSSKKAVIGGIIGGLLGFAFLVFCGVLLIRRYYHRNNFFQRLCKSRLYSHRIMPFIIAEVTEGQQNNPYVNHESGSEKVRMPAPPPIPIPPPVHFPDVYGLSPYGTLQTPYTPSVANQSVRSQWTIDADDVPQLQRSNSTSTSTSTSTSAASTVLPVSNYLGIPTAFTLSPVREEGAGHRATLPPDYNSVWSTDSEAGTLSLRPPMS